MFQFFQVVLQGAAAHEVEQGREYDILQALLGEGVRRFGCLSEPLCVVSKCVKHWKHCKRLLLMQKYIQDYQTITIIYIYMYVYIYVYTYIYIYIHIRIHVHLVDLTLPLHNSGVAPSLAPLRRTLDIISCRWWAMGNSTRNDG